jgi:hypothetical protein
MSLPSNKGNAWQMLHLLIGFALLIIYLAKILNHRVLPESIARQLAKYLS